MLKIERVRRYNLPKYPKGLYFQKPPPLPGMLLKRGAATLVMLALLESCGDTTTGVTGPPPLLPDTVTENEARQIIGQVFSNNGVTLNEDVRFVLFHGQNDSTELELDGFNDSLQVGYEYLFDLDYMEFDFEVRQTLDSLANETGPYIKVMDMENKFDDYQKIMENMMQEFIDTLKAQGII